MHTFLIILFIMMNLVGLMIMKLDKKRAIKHQYRISEATLWLVALLFGAIGMTLGMNVFKHKTKHLQFKVGLPLLSLIEIVLFIYIYNVLS